VPFFVAAINCYWFAVGPKGKAANLLAKATNKA